IDVADLQTQPFLEPESQRVDRPEIGPVVGRADGRDEPPHLIDGEHVREFLLLANAEPLEGRPVTGRGVGIEELDGAVSDHERPGGELAVVLEVEEVIAELMLAEPIGRGVEVVGELPDRAEVGLLGTLAQAGELKVLEHPLAECRGHVLVLSQKVEKPPLLRNLEAWPRALPGGRECAGIPVTTTESQATLGKDGSSCRASGLLERGRRWTPHKRWGHSVLMNSIRLASARARGAAL